MAWIRARAVARVRLRQGMEQWFGLGLEQWLGLGLEQWLELG